jgi:hypothetical protein
LFQCGVFNFKRRDNCFKCYASREESEKGGEGSDEVSSILTKSNNFILIKLHYLSVPLGNETIEKCHKTKKNLMNNFDETKKQDFTNEYRFSFHTRH